MNTIPMQELIEMLHMKHQWTNDYIGEFYTSRIQIPASMLGNQFDSQRPMYTWAYYLLPSGSICPFHKLKSDESWQYCMGSAMNLYVIQPSGKLETICIGPNLRRKERFIHIVPSKHWMAATPCDEESYSLICHNVSPGYHPDDDIPGYKYDLIEKFPEHEALIHKLAWPE